MDDLTGKGLLEIVEEAGYTAASYSGRGMFGDKCIVIWFKHGDCQTALGDIAEMSDDLAHMHARRVAREALEVEP